MRSLRDERQWSQEEAAHRARMATRLIQRVESAEVNATVVTLARLCEGFEVDILRLFEAAEPPVRRPRGRPRR